MSDTFNHEMDAWDSLDQTDHMSCHDYDYFTGVGSDHRRYTLADGFIEAPIKRKKKLHRGDKKPVRRGVPQKRYQTQRLRDVILSSLSDLGAYVVSQGHPNARYNSDPSIYIKFTDTRIRSLRIGDHDGYGKYKYKWNLRIDSVKEGAVYDKGTTRFYYCANAVEDLIVHIRNYHNTIKRRSHE